MEFPCNVCDRSIIEQELKYYEYLATLRKIDDKSLYRKFTINNVDLEEVNKILNDYISTHNKYFDYYFKICEFVAEFDKKVSSKYKK